MNPKPPYMFPDHFIDLKSLTICMLTIVLNAAPQLPVVLGSVTSCMTAIAALTTVLYNLFKFINDLKNKK